MIDPFFIILVAIFLGTLSSYLARKKNRSPLYWFFIGAYLGVIGLIILYFLPSKSKNLDLVPALNKGYPEPKAQSELSLPPRKDSSSWIKKNQLWYFLDKDNKQFGPMSLNGLKQSWIDDLMTSQTYIWCEDMEDWKRLEDVPDIHSLVRGASY